jgi:hypothetical protein
MRIQIATVGFTHGLPGTDTISIENLRSVADANLVLLAINNSFFNDLDRDARESAKTGLLRLTEKATHAAFRRLSWWRNQIETSLAGGKTVIVLLDSLANRETADGHFLTAFAALPEFPNWKWLPVPEAGQRMRLDQGAHLIAPLWRIVQPYMQFACALKSTPGRRLITTINEPRHTVAFHVQDKGNFIFLPGINLFRDPAPATLPQAFVQAVSEIHDELTGGTERTPPPDWANESTNRLAGEVILLDRIAKAQQEVQRWTQTADSLQDELNELSELRGLLFESGRALERAIIKALRVMGFSANAYKQDHSEFDVVFESAEGRLLGEAEGKENKPVNVDKARQLMNNIAEDADINVNAPPAKGVLFSNAYRLKELKDRPEWFTDKCVLTAVAQNLALVKTPDLFAVTKYLSEHNDQDFALRCRRAMLEGKGEINFPPLPG